MVVLSGSVWMHIAYTGPKILKINGEGYPIQPYGYKNNPYSILDVADIVFINICVFKVLEIDGKKAYREQFLE